MRVLGVVLAMVAASCTAGGTEETAVGEPPALDAAAQERLDGFSRVAEVFGVELDDATVSCLAADGVLTVDAPDLEETSDLAILGVTRCAPDTVGDRLVTDVEERNPDATADQRAALRCVVDEGVRLTVERSIEDNVAELRLPIAERNAQREADLLEACPGSDEQLDGLR